LRKRVVSRLTPEEIEQADRLVKARFEADTAAASGG
jgi:hypothetical protein